MRNLAYSMSHLVLAVSLVMLFGIMGTAAQAQDQDESLVLYLPFDEGDGDEVEDLSMYGNDGTLQNDPEWVAGKYDSALEFSINGMNWVQVPDDDTLDITEELTMMAWVLSKGQDTYARIVDKNNPYMVELFSDDTLWAYFEGGGDYTSTATVPRNEWAHVAVTYDGSDLRFYVNGELEDTLNAGVTLNVSENPLTIGNMTGGAVGNQGEGNNVRPFFGAIDEVKIYNRALSDGEIAEAMEPAAVQPSEKLATSWGRLKSF